MGKHFLAVPSSTIIFTKKEALGKTEMLVGRQYRSRFSRFGFKEYRKKEFQIRRDGKEWLLRLLDLFQF